MNEKTLVKIFNEAFEEAFITTLAAPTPAEHTRAATEKALEAVIEAHEARKWQPIETAPLGQEILTLQEGGEIYGCMRHSFSGFPHEIGKVFQYNAKNSRGETVKLDAVYCLKCAGIKEVKNGR